MSFEALHERLAALQETTAQLKELIDRLANLKFQPGSVPLGNTEDNVSTELSSEINLILREEDEDLELLQEEIHYLPAGRAGSDEEHHKTRLVDGTARLQQELRSCRLSFRKAQLAARASLASAQRLERTLLAASYTTPPTSTPGTTPSPSGSGILPPRRRQRGDPDQHQHQHPLSRDEQLAQAGTDVTAALRRAHAQMAAELARSAFARQTLAESTAALGSLGESYGSLGDMLAASRHLLGHLLRSQKSDTWYLQTALYVLVATAAWLVFRRWLYGPAWWLVWLPLRLALTGTWRAGTAVVGGRGAAGAGGSARMGVAGGPEGQPTRIVGMADGDAVPTIEVGGGSPATREDGEPDSMMEKVGRMMDDSERLAGDAGMPDEAFEEEPNPKKRMWEQDQEAAREAPMHRDEL